ncbi:MAG TPA: thioesterase family protein, partial [Steroidobacteraceae bacterium]|nr:thioesterase family protein [Steroidobacteraceae bacterium]
MSTAAFTMASVAGWAEMDANAHMANTAYLSKCVDARMSFFKDNGFPVTEFAKRQIGPVVRRDELEYFRE